MEEVGKDVAGQQTRRVRRPTSSCRKPGGGPADLDDGFRTDPHAESGALSASSVEQVVRKATAACVSSEIEPGVSMAAALATPTSRAQAAKWRSGSESRRVTAVLARMLQGLQAIKPTWLDSEPVELEPPVAQPLPVHRPQAVEVTPWARLMKFGGLAHRLKSMWRTWAILLVLLFFPRLTAMILTLLVRLVFRAFYAILARMFIEIGREMKQLLSQATLATSAVEDTVVSLLDDLFQDPLGQLLPQPEIAEAPMAHGPQPGAPPYGAPPSSPWSFCSTVLLAINLAHPFYARGGRVEIYDVVMMAW